VLLNGGASTGTGVGGSVVVTSLPASVVAVGVPAKVVKRLAESDEPVAEMDQVG
jgi:serine acetyltransferase